MESMPVTVVEAKSMRTFKNCPREHMNCYNVESYGAVLGERWSLVGMVKLDQMACFHDLHLLIPLVNTTAGVKLTHFWKITK